MDTIVLNFDNFCDLYTEILMLCCVIRYIHTYTYVYGEKERQTEKAAVPSLKDGLYLWSVMVSLVEFAISNVDLYMCVFILIFLYKHNTAQLTAYSVYTAKIETKGKGKRAPSPGTCMKETNWMYQWFIAHVLAVQSAYIHIWSVCTRQTMCIVFFGVFGVFVCEWCTLRYGHAFGLLNVYDGDSNDAVCVYQWW